MTQKQERFCEEYLVDLNATQAAIRTGYSEQTAKEQGCQLLTKLNIQERIAGLQKERSERTQITVDRVVEELKYIGLANIKNYVDAATKGFVTFKDIDEISEEDARAIESIKADYKDGKIEFKLHSKTRALEMLGRHLAMFTDKLEHGGKFEAVIISDKFLPKDNGTEPE